MLISLKRKKIFQKEKRHSSVFWKVFQISRNYFSLHMHFKCDVHNPANSFWSVWMSLNVFRLFLLLWHFSNLENYCFAFSFIWNIFVMELHVIFVHCLECNGFPCKIWTKILPRFRKTQTSWWDLRILGKISPISARFGQSRWDDQDRLAKILHGL